MSEEMRELVLCEVFRSPRRAETYLYTARSEGLARVPQALLDSFGEPESVLTFRLHRHRKLARVEASAVIEAIAEHGFYLQLPPQHPASVSPVAVAPGEEGAGAH